MEIIISEGGGGSGVLVARAGQENISNGSQTIAVLFSSDLGTTNYALTTSILNTTDTDPQYLTIVGVVKATTGFTAEFNAPADSANYKLSYTAVPYV